MLAIVEGLGEIELRLRFNDQGLAHGFRRRLRITSTAAIPATPITPGSGTN
jgi:hypothetical protein